MVGNIYKPHIAKVVDIKVETGDIKSFKFQFIDQTAQKEFIWKSGQFLILNIFGVGEAVFTFANPQTRNEYIECSIRKVGLVSEAVHELEVGDTVGIRGPYGNWFPFDKWQGKNLLYVAGGVGLAALRSPIEFSLDNKKDFRNITILYGARSPRDLCYKDKFSDWEKVKDTQMILTADKGADGWKHKVGFVPAVLKEVHPSPKDTVAIICGPPIMIKFVLKELLELGFTPLQIVTTLEMKMKCGLGKCGRCNVKHLYICKDGPVFTYAQLKDLPDEY
ncbi:MAG: FAD/NAD(P)-binding protein [Candidatus Firestonebacteria bacterium]